MFDAPLHRFLITFAQNFEKPSDTSYFARPPSVKNPLTEEHTLLFCCQEIATQTPEREENIGKKGEIAKKGEIDYIREIPKHQIHKKQKIYDIDKKKRYTT